MNGKYRRKLIIETLLDAATTLDILTASNNEVKLDGILSGQDHD